jgi:hypothetical protein
VPLKADLNRLITEQTESVKPGEFDALTDAELAAKEKAYDAILRLASQPQRLRPSHGNGQGS